MVSQLIDWFGTALKAPEVKARLDPHALYVNPMCGTGFAAHIRRQLDEYSRVIGELGIKGG